MNFEFWKKKNDELFAKAMDVLADYVIEEYVCDGDLKDATDLQECDGHDIQLFYFLLNDDRFCHCPEIPDGSFSIKEFNRRHTGHLGVKGIFEDYAHDIWEDCLDDDVREAVCDRIEVGRIVDKYAYGGGGFEVERDLEIGVRDRVAEKIKAKYAG